MGRAACFGQWADGEPRLLRRAFPRCCQRPVHHTDRLICLQRHTCRWDSLEENYNCPLPRLIPRLNLCSSPWILPILVPTSYPHRSLPCRPVLFPKAARWSCFPVRGKHWRRWKSCRGITCVGKAPRDIPHTRLSVHSTGKSTHTCMNNGIVLIFMRRWIPSLLLEENPPFHLQHFNSYNVMSKSKFLCNCIIQTFL